MKQFENRTIIVTGGNSGIGKAAALQFAAQGAEVAIVARNEETGQEVVDEIRKAGGTASFYQCDVADEQQIEAAHAAIIKDYGQFHAAFNNAGISGGAQPFHELDTATFDSIMKTNAYSVFWCMRIQIGHFIENKIAGSIVNCASIAGLLGRPYMASYVASKHAAVGLTRSAALDTAALGIRINAVCPGVTETPTLLSYIDMLPSEVKAQTLAAIPRGKMATSEELASTAVYLCTDLAANITGQAIANDGAFSVI
jgi:NAD(P)-dependent dehydrogenase (short-subunit alcohol dehydrogenase family)